MGLHGDVLGQVDDVEVGDDGALAVDEEAGAGALAAGKGRHVHGDGALLDVIRQISGVHGDLCPLGGDGAVRGDILPVAVPGELLASEADLGGRGALPFLHLLDQLAGFQFAAVQVEGDGVIRRPVGGDGPVRGHVFPVAVPGKLLVPVGDLGGLGAAPFLHLLNQVPGFQFPAVQIKGDRVLLCAAAGQHRSKDCQDHDQGHSFCIFSHGDPSIYIFENYTAKPRKLQ